MIWIVFIFILLITIYLNWIGLLLHPSIYINGLVQDCSNSSALTMELLQSCAKPSILCVIKSVTYNMLWGILSERFLQSVNCSSQNIKNLLQLIYKIQPFSKQISYNLKKICKESLVQLAINFEQLCKESLVQLSILFTQNHHSVGYVKPCSLLCVCKVWKENHVTTVHVYYYPNLHQQYSVFQVIGSLTF